MTVLYEPEVDDVQQWRLVTKQMVQSSPRLSVDDKCWGNGLDGL
jgi:hypothetical protein